ncbi:hypothetical protein LG634_27950 [Streptomyces bambusae]|uniref:hypothetical protein n=1 Tax=Streptomyces bambusae TaxID=1550616 RepID=UPI001CFCCB24|nr:hypothetical protein [Streptomyces bambusae]MCB5168641.1 hypothetical protein [Streptomyces bambusae]
MKQSAAKTLGVAALGAAFAAAAAGTASATPALGAADALSTVTGVTNAVPVADTLGKVTNHTQGEEGQSESSDPLKGATGLLGGLPLQGGGLPL